jgi:uncharacterized membrane protein YeiH
MTGVPLAEVHELPTWADVGAMVVAAVFGAYAARERAIPFSGILLAGVVVGVGGGITRDVLLGLEPAAITNWYYLPAVLIAAIIGGWTAHLVITSRLPFVATQAIATGLLTGIGVQKALEYHAPIPGVIFLGVVTGCFGGALADMLAGSRPAIMREGPLLLSIVIVASVVFWLCTTYLGFYIAVVATDLLVVTLRVLSFHFNWTSSPIFPGDDELDSQEP